MNSRFFMLMFATSGNERNETKFQSFYDVKDAEAVVQDWLMRYCGMECVPADQEEAVRAANGGELPEDVFLCPTVKEPKDLVKYNGFYDYESLGLFNLFLTPVYDKETALQFRGGMNKEYGIDAEWSERSDKMMAYLDTFVASFEDDTIDITETEKAMQDFLVQGGFSLFEDAGDPDFGLSGGMNQWDGMDSMGSMGSMGGMDGVPGMGGRNLW